MDKFNINDNFNFISPNSEKSYHENMYKMQYGDKEVFRNFYIFASPKFLPPLPPPAYSPIKDYAKETFDHQISVSSTIVYA